MPLSLLYPGRRKLVRTFGAMGVAALLAANAGCAAQAQTDIPPAAPRAQLADAAVAPLPRPNAPVPLKRPPRGDPMQGPLADDGELSTAQAVVARFLINPDGDVDGFLTSEGALVRFPPHMGSQLASTIRQGDSVQISGLRDPAGNFTAQRIVDKRSGRQLISQPPLPGEQAMPRELRAARLARLSVQGQVAHVTTAPRGEPDGVILADGTVIRLTPPMAQQFPSLLQVGANVAAQGYGTRNQYGTALQVTAFGPPGNVKQIYERAPLAP